MSVEFFASACSQPSASYQQGLDQGHAGLTAALNDVVRKLSPDFLKELTTELDCCAQANIPSPLAEKIYQRAICVYQAGQLLGSRQNADASQSETTSKDAGLTHPSDIVTRRAG